MNDALRVAIYFRTRNRSDFVIRQLEYYAAQNSPHPVYIADASDKDDALKTQKAIERLKGRLKVIYKWYPWSETMNQSDIHCAIISLIKEKYGASIGDDDYFIPDSLTKCAEFLEKNPDYASASGYAVSCYIQDNGTYGKIDYIADYPRKQVEFPTASERLVKFFEEYYTSGFYVHRMEPMRRYWTLAKDIPDFSLSTEIVHSALLVSKGKAKIVDCLSLIRQIHNRHVKVSNTYDWIMSDKWYPSHKMAEEILSKEIMDIDKVSEAEAKKSFRKGFWTYINDCLIQDFNYEFPSPDEKEKLHKIYMRKIRSFAGRMFPAAKRIYRTKIKPRRTGQKYLHSLVIDPGSEYYKDFRPITDSFSGKYIDIR